MILFFLKVFVLSGFVLGSILLGATLYANAGRWPPGSNASVFEHWCWEHRTLAKALSFFILVLLASVWITFLHWLAS